MIRFCTIVAFLLATASSSFGFIRGDVNDDGGIDISDPVAVLAVLFTPGTPALDCPDRGDANDDGGLDISDGVYLLSMLFIMGSPVPPEPFPMDGDDPTPDALTPDCPTVNPPGPGNFFTLAQGDDSSAPEGEYLIFNETDWIDFWALHGGAGAPPAVDFSTDIVVAVIRSYPNFEHCIEIAALQDAGTSTSISVLHYQEATPMCAIYLLPTTPFHIVSWENASGVPMNSTFGEQQQDVCPLPCP